MTNERMKSAFMLGALVPALLLALPGVAGNQLEEKLYAELLAAGIDVLIEDRDERPGVLFADMDLLGIPHRLVISERGLAAGTIEYKGRTQATAENAPLAAARPSWAVG